MVERVHRLAELEQHVVGDVDDVADRADAAGVQPRLHPVGRRADGDVGDGADVARAELRVVDDDVDVGDPARDPGLDGAPASPSPGRGPGVRAVAGPEPPCSGSPYAVAISRAMPTTDMQSGRFAGDLEIEMHPRRQARPSRGSIPSTAKPRTDIVARDLLRRAGHVHELAQPGERGPS